MVLPLVDNFDTDTYQYEVHVYTGFRQNAETDSNIKIVMAGTEADSGVRPLNDGQRKVKFTVVKQIHVKNLTFLLNIRK